MALSIRRFALVFVAAAAALVATASPPQQFDREGLETAEVLSESLANDLLELSVNLRDRDLEAVGKFFSGDEVNIPMSFFLDEHGNVLKVFSGWSPESGEQIQKLVEAEIEVEIEVAARFLRLER